MVDCDCDPVINDVKLESIVGFSFSFGSGSLDAGGRVYEVSK